MKRFLFLILIPLLMGFVTEKQRVIKITPDKYMQMSKDFGDPNTAYDSKKGELSFRIKEITGKAWRLVHDGKKAVLIEGETNTVTAAPYNMMIEEFETQKEAEDRIKELGLEYEPPETGLKKSL